MSSPSHPALTSLDQQKPPLSSPIYQALTSCLRTFAEVIHHAGASEYKGKSCVAQSSWTHQRVRLEYWASNVKASEESTRKGVAFLDYALRDPDKGSTTTPRMTRESIRNALVEIERMLTEVKKGVVPIEYTANLKDFGRNADFISNSFSIIKGRIGYLEDLATRIPGSKTATEYTRTNVVYRSMFADR
ncbi:MAG: hypothetical protein LQ349_009905 [Xanthoria aureola]|nr:MAG: hypothetical protein LQ349_009905 [Xanthoria aureola]